MAAVCDHRAAIAGLQELPERRRETGASRTWAWSRLLLNFLWDLIKQYQYLSPSWLIFLIRNPIDNFLVFMDRGLWVTQ